MMFQDRKDAGIRLAEALEKYQGEEVVVLALPRGGVPLGVEVAKKLKAPLDLVITKKIGHPLNSEYAICALAEEGEPICNTYEVNRVEPSWFQAEVKRIRSEMKRRRKEYCGEMKPQEIKGKTVIIVDDGIATGFTMIAAIKEIKQRGPKKVVVAIPVTPYDTAQKLEELADDFVSLAIDKNYLGAVGAYYREFGQVGDSEVRALLKSMEMRHSDE